MERPEVIGRSVGVTFHEHEHTAGPTFRVILTTAGMLLSRSDFALASPPNMAVLRRCITGAWGTRMYQLPCQVQLWNGLPGVDGRILTEIVLLVSEASTSCTAADVERLALSNFSIILLQIS